VFYADIGLLDKLLLFRCIVAMKHHHQASSVIINHYPFSPSYVISAIAMLSVSVVSCNFHAPAAFFTVRRISKRGLNCRRNVCPSVRPSIRHSLVVSKRRNILLSCQCHIVASYCGYQNFANFLTDHSQLWHQIRLGWLQLAFSDQ